MAEQLACSIGKKYCNILFERLCVVYHLEADFNWWLELIYTQRLMADVRLSKLMIV